MEQVIKNQFGGLPREYEKITSISKEPTLDVRELGKRTRKQQWYVSCFYILDPFFIYFDSKKKAQAFIDEQIAQGASTKSPYDKGITYPKDQWTQRWDDVADGKDVDVFAAIDKAYGNEYQVWFRYAFYGDKKTRNEISSRVLRIYSSTLDGAKAKAKAALQPKFPGVTLNFK